MDFGSCHRQPCLPYVFSGGAAFNDIHAPPAWLLLASTGTAFVPTGALVSAYKTSGAAPEAPPRTTQRGLDLDAWVSVERYII